MADYCVAIMFFNFRFSINVIISVKLWSHDYIVYCASVIIIVYCEINENITSRNFIVFVLGYMKI